VQVRNKSARGRHQRGAALLIAIFALLLVSVVAIALLVSSGTDTALSSNYRTSTAAYYAALAGLEEGRGRILWKASDFVNNQVANFVPAPGGALDVHQVLYIVNPLNGENVTPTDPSNQYADTEYGTEFTWGLGGATIQGPVTSDSPAPSPGYPGPSYKWVRINPVTEVSMGNVDVDGQHALNPSGPFDSTTPLFFDTAAGLNRNYSGNQALELTALAVLPNGTRKMLQYVVGPMGISVNFPAAITLASFPSQSSPAPYVQFNGPGTPSFYVIGNDQYSVGSCTPTASPVYGIGYPTGSDTSKGMVTTPIDRYQGVGGSPTTPSVGAVTLPASFQTQSSLSSFVQNFSASADVALTPTAPATSITWSQLPTAMSATNPMSIFVNGDLDLTGWTGTGYGLLIVTGTLTYDPKASWSGIVLVVGKGIYTSSVSPHGAGQITGALLIGDTIDNNGASFAQNGSNPPSGSGVFFSSCNIKMAQQPSTYKVLSFREIPLAD
jgi:hypothetical protein